MFTGIVGEMGEIVELGPRDDGLWMEISTSWKDPDFQIGESIAVDGVCLTVERFSASNFWVTCGAETLACTNLDERTPGRKVNLERALAAGDRLGGHIVSGHVDGVGRVVSSRQEGESTVIWMEAPTGLARYIARKGSICVDGVSLTVNEVDGARFRVNIVPHTLEVTHVGRYDEGTRVNLEVDLVARYLERLLSAREENR
ncbi:MAG: riboflavin synthase [Myxococcota bacterium]|nr:riboflavin synthase [Myxococcota bacterium]